MRLSTRLLIVLVPAVTGVMLVYAMWAVEQRQSSLSEQARVEARAYADAVGVAFEHAFRDLQFRDIQQILNAVSRQPQIYGVLVYDTLGAPIMISEGLATDDAVPPERARSALTSSVTVERRIGAEPVLSVLRPIPGSEAGAVGLLEVVQPLAFLEREKARTRQRFVLNTLTLVGIVAALTVWLLRRLVDRPLQRLVTAIQDVGEGDLSARVDQTRSGSELDALRTEFNRMADALESARDALLGEAEERIALEHRMREREQLAAMGTLAGGVAHQISAPLNVIEGRARRMLDRPPAGPELERNLRTIVEQSGRIVRIVRGLLGFARRPEPRSELVDMQEIARAALEHSSAEAADANVKCHLEASGPTWVRGDRDLLEEALLILLMNALDAVREGGGGEIGVRIFPSGAGVTVEVWDTGIGIPADAIPRIFEAFFTTKPGGTGLGLAIVRDIVQRMGGSIEASSDGRTVLSIELPAGESGGIEDA